MTHIQLDANAGSSPRPEVLRALHQFLESGTLANPSSVHALGRAAKKLWMNAAEEVARSIGADPEHLLFTSSGTEANQTAIRSALEQALEEEKSAHWILSSVEHDSCLQLVPWFKERGGEVSFLPVDAHGNIDVAQVSSLATAQTRLISAIWVNNETGVVADVAGLAQRCQTLGIPLHIDAAQAWGKIPVNICELGADWISFSGHKIGALAGTGVLWRSKRARVLPLILGKQQSGLRGGTENLLGQLSLGEAAKHVRLPSVPITHGLSSREERIVRSIPGTVVNGSGAPRVASTMNLSFEGIESDQHQPGLVAALDLRGFAVSAGSACSAGLPEPSHVLLAMGRSRAAAGAAIRISWSSWSSWSLGDTLNEEKFAAFHNALVDSVRSMRKSHP